MQGHSAHGMLYTTPFLWFAGTGSLGSTSSCLRVFKGRKVTWMARGPRPYGWIRTVHWCRGESQIHGAHSHVESADQAVGRCACVWTPWGNHFPGGPATKASLPEHNSLLTKRGPLLCTSVSSHQLVCGLWGGGSESTDADLCGQVRSSIKWSSLASNHHNQTCKTTKQMHTLASA